MATKHPPTSITNIAADALAQTRGSLNDVVHGSVMKMGHTEPWDMSREWIGRALVEWKARESLWDRSIRVTFSCALSSSSAGMPLFTLSLKPPVSDEEVARSAETHMLLLNMTRTVT
jgi:hypothetical protein